MPKRRTVTLEQKIEIFEKFAQTGEKLVGNTTFEGYPIGQWAIKIRNSLNRVNSDKDSRFTIKPTEEQIKKLESMSILERQIDSTIDEKIDSLVEWRKKYPKVKIVPTASKAELKEYAKTDDEYKQMQEEYEKMQRYYEYVRERNSKNKLNEEQISKCKEGGIGGVFGYSTKIEELAKKYGITEEYIDYIFTEYGTLDNFYTMYKKGMIEGKKDIELEAIIQDAIDVDGNSNEGYNKLWKSLGFSKIGKIFYSSDELKKVIEQLPEREKVVLDRMYGLTEGTKPKTIEIIGKEMDVTSERIRQIATKALGRLRNTYRMYKCFRFEFSYSDEFITDKEREQIEEIKKDIQLQNGDISENLKKLKSINEEIRKRIQEKNKITTENLKQRIIEGQQPIEGLTQFSYEDLLEMGLEPELATKVRLEIDKYKDREEGQERLELEKMDFSRNTYVCLRRSGIQTLTDLSNITEEELRKIRNLGKKAYDEVVAKMNEYGISFKAKEKIEQVKAVKNDDQQQEKINDMIPEQLQDTINQKNIESNEKQIKEDTEKSELIQKLIKQQETIDAQQEEIKRLKKILGTQQQ